MAYQQNPQNNQYMAPNPGFVNGFPAPQNTSQANIPAYPIKPQQINYQNFQTSAIKPQQHQNVLTNGNGNGSALSSRTASPATMKALNSPLAAPYPNQIPASQLPPSINRPNMNMPASGLNMNSSQPSQFGATVPHNIIPTQANANNNVHTMSTNGFGSLSTPNISQLSNQMPLTTSMQSLNVNDQARPNLNMMSNTVNNNNVPASNLKAPINRFAAPQSAPSFAQPMQGQNFMPATTKAAPGKRLYPSNIGTQAAPGMQQQFNQAPQQANYPSNQITGLQTQASPQNMQYQDLHLQQTTQQSQQAQQHSVVNSGFNKLWGNETIDLMQQRHVLPTTKVLPPPIKLNHHFQEAINCNPE